MATLTTDNRLQFVQNDTADILLVRVGGDTPIDITGFTFYLKLGYPQKALVKQGAITNATTGELQFTFDYGDLQPGSVEAEILMIDGAGKQKTFQGLHLDIARRLKGSP